MILGQRTQPHQCKVGDATIYDNGDAYPFHAFPVGTVVECDECGTGWEAVERPMVYRGQMRADPVMVRLSRRQLRKAREDLAA